MFNNIGGKIKLCAQIVAWAGIIAFVILGLVIMAQGISYNSAGLVFAGLIVGAIGALIAWVSSFVIYGFGQLVQNTDKLVKGSAPVSQSHTAGTSSNEARDAALRELKEKNLISDADVEEARRNGNE